MENFFVIGDSHVNFFGGHEKITWLPLKYNDTVLSINCSPRPMVKNFFFFHIGPALAYNLNKYGTTTQAREKIDFLISSGIIPVGSNILFAFGEIDIRVHVLKQAKEQNIPFENVVDKILENYLDFLKSIRENAGGGGFKICVWGPIPSQKDGSTINPAFPYFGTEKERNIATEYFNVRLHHLCLRNGFKFFSVFKYLIDENYQTKKEFIADGCHLSQRAWAFAIKEFKKENIEILFDENFS